jgi:hypothetical protein
MSRYAGDALHHLIERQDFLFDDPSKLARYPLSGVAWFGPQLRASNEHILIVRVP